MEAVAISRDLIVGDEDPLSFVKQKSKDRLDKIMIDNAVSLMNMIREYAEGYTNSRYVREILAMALWSPSITDCELRKRLCIGSKTSLLLCVPDWACFSRYAPRIH